MSSKSLWIFGYGSLLWSPGFQFTASKQGTIRGYSRKFWQGNTTHRGTPEQPGRVATLVEEKDGVVWGVAYEVCNGDALPYLDERECQLGGYTTALSMFYPSCGAEAFPALLYMATPDSCHWLGHASEHEIAKQILNSSGPSGHNVEYLLRLAEYTRDHAPHIPDTHLYNLEKLVRKLLEKLSLPVHLLMGPTPPPVTPVTALPSSDEQPTPSTSIQFTSTLPTKQLRCVSI